MSQYDRGGIRGSYECTTCKNKFDFKVERDTHEPTCPKLYKSKKFQFDKEQDFGLSNGRNQFNCFMNSILQLFFNVKKLRECIEVYDKSVKNRNQYPETKILDSIVVSNLKIPFDL